MTLPKIVFDLDGTLADVRHRRHHVEGKDKDFPAFHAECPDDSPNQAVIDVFQGLWEVGHFELEIWSGRPETYRAETLAWLDVHLFQHLGGYIGEEEHNTITLKMRPENLWSVPDENLKYHWLVDEIADGQTIAMTFDDRDKVVGMWRKYGIPCFQVAEGGF